MKTLPSLYSLRPLACAALLFASAPAVFSANVKGVDVPDQITCGECELLLNGTAVRSVFGFKVYVVGLYLTELNKDGNVIMDEDRAEKRVHLTMLREVTPEKFGSTIQDNIDKNFTSAEKAKYANQLETFLGTFSNLASIKEGSTINIDFLPGKGTVVQLGNQTFEPIPGDDFFHAVLRLWIGKPPQESLKYGLLGVAG